MSIIPPADVDDGVNDGTDTDVDLDVDDGTDTEQILVLISTMTLTLTRIPAIANKTIEKRDSLQESRFFLSFYN